MTIIPNVYIVQCEPDQIEDIDGFTGIHGVYATRASAEAHKARLEEEAREDGMEDSLRYIVSVTPLLP
jgi:hypothetical protein